MTSFCKCFSSVWFLALDVLTPISHDFRQSLLKTTLLEGGNIAPIFKFPVRYKYFSMSDTVSGFPFVYSTETGLKRPLKIGLLPIH